MAKPLLCLIALSIVAGSYAQFAAERGTPPIIQIPQRARWPQAVEYVRKSTARTFKCRATGTPTPQYMWLFNGSEVQQKEGVISYDKDIGDLNVDIYFDQRFSGVYQCLAYNANGKSMSPFVTISATIANPFPGNEGSPPTRIEAFETSYLSLECEDIPRSVPKWKIKWERGQRDPIDNSVTTEEIPASGKRMIIDSAGTLHILWLELSDNNNIFTCSAENSIIQLTVKNTKSYYLQVEAGSQGGRDPEIKYIKDVTVHAGNNAELTCISTYYSRSGFSLKTHWIFKGKFVRDANGEPYEGTTLKLGKVPYPTEEDSREGQYMCNATLEGRSTFGKANLKIVAAPKFLPEKDLKATSVPVDADAVFHCGTTSHNSDTEPPVWLINAIPLIGCMPKQFECTQKHEDGFPICIPESEKCNGVPECPDDSDELMCKTVSCLEGMQECKGQCISIDEKCSGVSPCHWDGFSCWDESGCLERKMKCDGNPDCADGSDEVACPGGEDIYVQRFVLNSQRTELYVPQVSLTDTMCFQCMVSNDYGTLVGDGCLTVIDKIDLVYGPNDSYIIEPGMYLNIGVEAITDPDWQEQMKYEWFWLKPVGEQQGQGVGNEMVKESLPPKGFGEFFMISQSGQNLTIVIPEVKPEDPQSYKIYNTLKETQYSLVISHTYDSLEKDFMLIGDDIFPPVPKKVVVQAASANLWFIALILAILILFIVVALIICYMYRNRGGTYPLDKREHQAGHDPEQELKDSGFHDVGRIGDDYDDDRKPDEVSLSESVKPYESDEDITEEYGGDFDVSKFNEDGSFIGLYGDKKSKYSGGPKEATV